MRCVPLFSFLLTVFNSTRRAEKNQINEQNLSKVTWYAFEKCVVECRMSNVESGQKTPWTLSKVPSAPIWCSPVRKKRKRKRKMKGNQICEKMTAQTENFLITYWLSRKRALCATCKKSDPAETNLSRASRVRQDSQFHTVNKGDILFEWKILYRARILRSGGRSWPRRARKLLA